MINVTREKLGLDKLRSEKLRLDGALVERGLAPTRSQARDLIKRGCVTVDGATTTKAAQMVGDRAVIHVQEGAQPYVSRGGLKLAAALEAFGFDPGGVVALDVGASTGGFCDVLLKRNAAKVYAVDVGRGQLHPAIAGDPRLVMLEGQDARLLDASIIVEQPVAIVAVVSFISLTKVLGAAMALVAPGAWLVALIKPQFEVGRAEIGRGGVVRDPLARERAVETVREWVSAQAGWGVVGVIASPIAGGSGNVEMLLGARRHG